MTTKDSKKVRVIAGKLKNSNVFFYPSANNQSLRPTLDRHRERLFAWIAPMLAGSKVLDLFAGSGILSIEAYSRGASEVVLVERDKPTYQSIVANLQRLKIRDIKASNEDGEIAIKRLAKAKVSFDLIFLDPPFEANQEISQTLAYRIFKSLIESNLLNSGGLIYLEIPLGSKVTINQIAAIFLQLDDRLQVYKVKEFKSLAMLLFQKCQS